jgi:hypothetical protein
MRSTLQIAALAGVIGLFPVARAQAHPADACTTAIVHGYMLDEGLVHILLLTNHCERPVVCRVWTSTNPYPRQRLRAAPGETVQMIMRRGAKHPFNEVAGSSCRFE